MEGRCPGAGMVVVQGVGGQQAGGQPAACRAGGGAGVLWRCAGGGHAGSVGSTEGAVKRLAVRAALLNHRTKGEWWALSAKQQGEGGMHGRGRRVGHLV